GPVIERPSGTFGCAAPPPIRAAASWARRGGWPPSSSSSTRREERRDGVVRRHRRRWGAQRAGDGRLPGPGRASDAGARAAGGGGGRGRPRRAHTGAREPGVRVPTLAHTVGRLRPTIVRDLRLGDHGLALMLPRARVFAPQLGGPGLT